MSHSKDSIIVLDDEEEDSFLADSSKSSFIGDSKTSIAKKRKTLECHLLTKSKSLPAKIGSKSLTSTHSKKSWISSSFDGFGSVSSFDDVSKKKGTTKKTSYEGLSSEQNKKNISVNLWIDKYKPQSESDLAVHKKKIEEVRSWLLDHLCSKSNALLLLTGPVGVGKTATISALSTELDFEIQEWINPTTFTEGFSFGNEYSQSQLSQFKDFLLRSNKYPSLSIFGSSNENISTRKVILIEDLPNLFYKDAKKLHEVLMEYRLKGRCPLVLIISDSHNDDSNVHKLLPKAVQPKLGVSTISFNPVAITSLVKTLNKIVSLENKKAGKEFSSPSKDVINELAQSSAGDIRTAINALQFSCQKGVQDNIMSKYKSMTTSTVTKKQKKESSKTATTTKQEFQSKRAAIGVIGCKEDKEEVQDTAKAIGGKDTTIFLFRALGKILYCKRDSSISDKNLLPSHMSHLARNQPQFCPEVVVEKSHLSSEMLTLYLHQNYLDFFSDIHDVAVTSQYLSDANMMSVEWMHRTALIPYMSCIATRGLMYNTNHGCMNSATSRGGWRPLHKPQWFDVNKKAKDNHCIAKELFPEQTCSTAILHSQIIPYLAITDVTLRTPGQISFVQQMGQYQKNKSNFRSFTDTLDEKECGVGTDEDDATDSQICSQNRSAKVKPDAKTTISNQSKNQDSQDMDTEIVVNTDEDIVIEDFEDDW